MPTNPKVDKYLDRNPRWRAELEQLRRIVLRSPLVEDLKWGVPAYTFGGANVLLLHVFNEYCAMLFPKGVLLPDPAGILVIQTENVQAARQVRFTSVDEVLAREKALEAYVAAAIELEKSGAKVAFKSVEEFRVPEEFQARLDQDAALKRAFEALTPGRRKAYLLYFGGAKQPKTREARVEKYREAILAGKGLDD